MIPKPQLLSIATESRLLPTTVEKDYVLGWMLIGIARHPRLSQWIFKGGTCLKKCFFETYRFSEDLDFTVPEGAPYSLNDVEQALTEVTSSLSIEVGIQFPAAGFEAKESFNKRNKKTFVAKISFVGPLNQPKASQQRIKFDLTQDEIISDESVAKTIHHPYQDAISPSPTISCYSINEVLAEKTRALYERQGTPRDIYDVVNISRNFREDVDRSRARKALKEKFDFKNLPQPNVELILGQVDLDAIRSNWQISLGHQLSVLPPVNSFLDDLKDSLSWWMEERAVAQVRAQISSAKNEAVVPKEHFIRPSPAPSRRLGVGTMRTGAGLLSSDLERIRFAARNRLRVTIDYNDIRRVVEPYSLRRPQTGNLLLYVFEVRKGTGPGEGIKAYNVDNLRSVEVLNESFQPRYVVEL